MRLRLASYNIHGGIGADGRLDLDRILAVLRQLDCDVIALQEVVSTPAYGQLDALAAGIGGTGIAGPTLLRAGGHYGNAVLSRLPVLAVRRLDLSVPRREPRGALLVDLDAGGDRIRVTSTHLGLRPKERRIQIRRLLGALPEQGVGLSVLMGDINEWFLWGRPLRWLHARFGHAPGRPTFPSALPLLALDRIWVQPGPALRRVWVYGTPLTRAASDHLPILAEVAWP